MIYLLVWFLIPVAGGQNILQIQEYPSIEECRAAGDILNEASQMAVNDKRLITFGGTCYEVPASKHIPGRNEA